MLRREAGLAPWVGYVLKAMLGVHATGQSSALLHMSSSEDAAPHQNPLAESGTLHLFLNATSPLVNMPFVSSPLPSGFTNVNLGS